MENSTKIAVIPYTEFEELKAKLNKVLELIQEMCSTSGKRLHEDWLTSNAAAHLLGISTRTLSEWRKKGVVKASKVGRKLRFKRSDLEALLNRNTLNR